MLVEVAVVDMFEGGKKAVGAEEDKLEEAGAAGIVVALSVVVVVDMAVVEDNFVEAESVADSCCYYCYRSVLSVCIQTLQTHAERRKHRQTRIRQASRLEFHLGYYIGVQFHKAIDTGQQADLKIGSYYVRSTKVYLH